MGRPKLVLRGYYHWMEVWKKRDPPHCRNPHCRHTKDGVTDAPHCGRGYCQYCYPAARYREKKMAQRCSR